MASAVMLNGMPVKKLLSNLYYPRLISLLPLRFHLFVLYVRYHLLTTADPFGLTEPGTGS